MNTQLINLLNEGISLTRISDFIKSLLGEYAEIPLAEALIISRVLFAVVMFGFVGYFFDRMQQSAGAKQNTRKN